MSHPKSDLIDKIKVASMQYIEYVELFNDIQRTEIYLNMTNFKIEQKGLIWFKDRLHMPNIIEIKLFILNEMHKPPFVGHPEYQKMKAALRKQFFQAGLKTDLVDCLSKYLEYQQFKVKHQHPVGLLQPLPILEWKWEVISLDFIIGLSRTHKQHDSIMVVVAKLRRYAHFIPVKSTHKAVNIAEIFLKEIFRLHGVP